MGRIRRAVTNVVNVLALSGLSLLSATPVLAQHQSERSFQLQKARRFGSLPMVRLTYLSLCRGTKLMSQR
jgi:hypothetical protein